MRLHSNCYPTGKAIFVANVIFFVLIVGQTSQSHAMQVSPSMPELEPAKFVADDFSFDPIMIPFYSQPCLDANKKYLAVLQARSLRGNRQLIVYELPSGDIVRSEEMPGIGSAKLLTISTDLSALALESSRRDKVQIWRLPKDGNAEKVVELNFEDRYVGRFSWCKFIDESKLIVGESDGTVKAFSSKDGSELFESRARVERKNNSNHRLLQVARFSADHRFLCFMKENRRENGDDPKFKFVVKAIDLQRGDLVAEIPLRVDRDYRLSNFDLSPDGKRFCTSLSSNKKNLRTSIAIWNAKTGELLKRLEQPRIGLGAASWLTNDLLAVNDVIFSVRENRALVDLGDVRPFQTVAGPGQMLFQSSLGQHYQIVHPSPLADFWVIYCQKLDEGAIRDAANVQAYKSQRLKDGDSIAVNVEMRAKSPIANFDSDFNKGIEDSLRQAGFEVDRSSQTKLNVTVTEKPTGNVFEYSQFVSGSKIPVGKSYRLSEIVVAFDMKFVDDDGEFAQARGSAGMPSGELELKTGQSVQKLVRQWRWESVLRRAQNYRFYRSYCSFSVPKFDIKIAPDATIVKAKADAIEAAAEDGNGRNNRGMRGKVAGRANAKPSPIVDGKLRPIVLPVARSSVPWKMKPFALQPMAIRTLREPMSISGGEQTPDGVKLATVKTKQAAVLLRSDSNDCTLYRYDLDTRKMLTETPVSDHSKFLDFRLDGKFWVVTRGSRHRKLQVYSAISGEEANEKVAPDELLKELSVSGDGDIAAAWFSGSDTLLVCWMDKLAAYSISEDKQIYERPIESNIDGQPQVWVSADRSVFVQAAKGRIQLFRCKDGKTAGELPMVIDDSGEILSVAFSPTGSRVAYLKKGLLEIRSLETGQLQQVVVNDDLKAPIQWCDDNFVMSMNMLISLDLGCAVWQYGKKWAESPFLSDAHQAGWYQAADAINRHYLVQVGTPNKRLYKQVGRYISQQRKLIKRGDTLGVEVRLGGEWAEDKVLKTKLTSAVTEQLERSGYKVDDILMNRVSIDAKMEETDDLRQSLQFGNGTKSVTLPDYMVTATATLHSTTGEQRQIDRVQFYLSSIDYSLDMAAADLKLEMLSQLKQALVNRIVEPPFPTAVYEQDDHRLGQSELRDGREFPILSKKGKALVGE